MDSGLEEVVEFDDVVFLWLLYLTCIVDEYLCLFTIQSIMTIWARVSSFSTIILTLPLMCGPKLPLN